MYFSYFIHIELSIQLLLLNQFYYLTVPKDEKDECQLAYSVAVCKTNNWKDVTKKTNYIHAYFVNM